MRTFVAVKVPAGEKLCQTLSEIRQALGDEKIKWVDVHSLHLTLFFLGDTREALIPAIGSGLQDIAGKTAEMRICLRGAGVFRNFRDPRVLWVGIESNPSLQALHSTVGDFLVSLGFTAENRDFRPHLTIGRPRWIRDKARLQEVFTRYQDLFIQEYIAGEMIHFESRLTERGSVYSLLTKCGFLPGTRG